MGGSASVHEFKYRIEPAQEDPKPKTQKPSVTKISSFNEAETSGKLASLKKSFSKSIANMAKDPDTIVYDQTLDFTEPSPRKSSLSTPRRNDEDSLSLPGTPRDEEKLAKERQEAEDALDKLEHKEMEFQKLKKVLTDTEKQQHIMQLLKARSTVEKVSPRGSDMDRFFRQVDDFKIIGPSRCILCHDKLKQITLDCGHGLCSDCNSSTRTCPSCFAPKGRMRRGSVAC